MTDPFRRCCLALVALLASACTALPAAIDIGQRYRDQPLGPAPDDAGPRQPLGGRLVHAAVAIDPWTADSLPAESLAELQALDARLDTELARVAGSVPLRERLPAEGGPKLFVGLPPEDGAVDFADLDAGPDRQRVALIRSWSASRAWRDQVRALLAREQADHLLLTWTGIGTRYPLQDDASGSKGLPLGTGYAPSLPWLTALDVPVEVVQLTGLLVDREGRVVRSAVEGMIAVPTRFPESVLGLQRSVQAADLRALPARVRDDLPGRPRVLDVALGHLVAQLTGRTGRR